MDFFLAPVIVKCPQTGKYHNVKVKDLSNEDGEPLQPEEVARSTTLVLTFKGKPYDVQFVRFKCIFK